jgi:hypothetical protein
MWAHRYGADGQAQRAFEERGGERGEWFQSDVKVSAGVALAPDSGGRLTDEQHWKVPGLVAR